MHNEFVLSGPESLAPLLMVLLLLKMQWMTIELEFSIVLNITDQREIVLIIFFSY